MNPDQFLILLLAAVPELAPVVREHIADNDGVLPHVLMGDVTRWAIDSAGDEPRRRFFAALEQGLALGSEDVAELLNVSFLEDLDVVAGEPALRALFGPRLAAEWRRRVAA